MKNDKNQQSEELGIKALADALRMGGTLLSEACPVCNNPLIRVDERIFCKVCDKEVLIYKDERELPADIQRALQQSKEPAQTQQTEYQSKMTSTLQKKIESLREKLEATDDPDEIIKLSEAIDKLLATLQRVGTN